MIDQESSNIITNNDQNQEPEQLSPHFLTISQHFKPTQQDRYLYEHYGNFPVMKQVNQVGDLPTFTDTIEQHFIGTPDFGKRTSCTLGYNFPGIKYDLKNIYLYVSVTDPQQMIKNIRDVVNSIEIRVNGMMFQKYTGNFLDLYSQLMRRAGFFKDKQDLWIPIPITLTQETPFPFYYLKHHNFKITVDFANLVPSMSETGIIMNWARIYTEYQFPNYDEKSPKLIVDDLDPVQYLIEQVQFHGSELLSSRASCFKFRLNFNRPVKTLLWNFYFQHKKTGEVVTVDEALILEAKIQLNGLDIVPRMPASYFNNLIPAKFNSLVSTGNSNLYVYTFADEPTWKRPTGTINLNDVTQNIQIRLRSDVYQDVPEEYNLMFEAYAISYNVLEIDPFFGVGVRFSM